MLKVISLYTIQQILEKEANGKLTLISMMAYINTLMYYFQDKPANMDNLKGFDVDIKATKNPEKSRTYFREMQECNLVKIDGDTITFYNHWTKYIDKSKLERAEPHEYLATMSWRPAIEFEQTILNDQSLFDLMGLQHKLSVQTIQEQIKLFIKEQVVIKKHYANEGEALRHCMAWIGKRANNLPKTTNNKKPRLLG